MNFFNLHNHTEFSFLDGYGTPEQISTRLNEIKQDGIALTDHGVIYSHVPFNSVFKKTKQHLVFGCEMYVVGELKQERGYNHITVLAKTQEGYQSLLWLVNQSYKEGQFYYKPRVTLNQIIDHSKGLVILSGCSLDSILIKNKGEDQEKFFGQVVKLFKNMEWYVEIQPFKDEQVKWDFLVEMAHRHKIPCVITADCHYPSEKYKKTHDFMLAINTNKPMSDPDRLKMEYDLFIPSADTIWERATVMGMSGKEASETMQRSYDIAHSCVVELPMTGLVIVGHGFDKLRSMCFEGLKQRKLDKLKNYVDRMEYELNLIKEKKYEDYFFIIADLMKWAREEMLCGPGRGSSAGSLACYCLQITEVDPIKHGLMFERFIDINRKDLPDIDLDFPSDRREEVIAYLSNKYGKEKVSQLVNFNKYRPRAIVQAACRVFDLPPWEAKNATINIIERNIGDARYDNCLEDSLKQSSVLKALFDRFPRMFDAIALEGQVMQLGKHAAAVIISNDPLETIGSINKDGVFCMDKRGAEEQGLLKIDILGLNTLDIIRDICINIGIDSSLLFSLPLNDQETFSKVFSPCHLHGIFQFDGTAVWDITKDIRPSKFEQLVHITAIARPGVSNSEGAKDYIIRSKSTNDLWKKNVPSRLLALTIDTYGVILFQEQVMAVMREIGKLSWEDVCLVRTGIGKSKGEEYLHKYKKAFMKGALTSGSDERTALWIWAQCVTHGSYSFNKAHAVSYSLLSYWTAWLKAHYPAQYYARILKDKTDESDIKPILKEWGKKIIPLDINISNKYFSVLDAETLVGGFVNVPGVGEKMADKIVDAQPFEDIRDFKSRIAKGLSAKIEHALTQGLEWANTQTLEEQYKNALENLKLSSPLTSYENIGKSGVMIAKVMDVNLRNSNDPDKVQKRGKKISGYPEYIILKIKDDSESVWHVYCPHRLTEKYKQDMLGLTGKVCLFKLKRSSEICECEKYKILSLKEENSG